MDLDTAWLASRGRAMNHRDQARPDKQDKEGAQFFEWRQSDNDLEWQKELTTQAPAASASAVVTKWKVLVLLFLVVVLAASWKWHVVQSQVESQKAELAAAVAAHLRPATVKVDLLEQLGDLALVRLLIQQQGSAGTYRQLQVYQQTATGWQPTATAARLWGKPQELQSSRFVFRYRERDGEAVAQTAAKLDALYLVFWHTFFTGEPANEKQLIEVDPEFQGGTPIAQGQPSEAYLVTSPATRLAPVQASDADLLLQSVALLLLNRLADQAIQRYAYPPYSESFTAALYLHHVTDTLRLWRLAELDLPAELWQAPAMPRTDPFIQEFAAEICALHRHQLAPAAPQPNPDSAAGETCVDAWRIGYATQLRLAQLVAFEPVETGPGLGGPSGQLSQLAHPAAAVVLATVFDYAAATYGQERMPLLLADFGKHRSWETLVPVVFSVSAADFEVGWKKYLAQKYGAK